MLPATALGRGSRKEPLQPGGFLLSHTLWAEGSKSSGQVGVIELDNLWSLCFHNSKKLSLLDFTFLSFRPGTSLWESQLLWVSTPNTIVSRDRHVLTTTSPITTTTTTNNTTLTTTTTTFTTTTTSPITNNAFFAFRWIFQKKICNSNRS